MIPQLLPHFVIRLWILLSLFQGRDWVVKWQWKPMHFICIWLPEHQRKKIEANNYDGVQKCIGKQKYWQWPKVTDTRYWVASELTCILNFDGVKTRKDRVYYFLSFFFFFSSPLFFVTLYYYYRNSWLCALIFLKKMCIINMWMCSSDKMYIILPSSRQYRESAYVFFSSRSVFTQKYPTIQKQLGIICHSISKQGM